MSTNFYVIPPGTPDDEDGIHLGKSSIGWAFTFRGYPEDSPAGAPVTDYASWLPLLDLGPVMAEYGLAVPRADLLTLIEAKRGGLNTLYGSDHLDPDGNRFTNVEFC